MHTLTALLSSLIFGAGIVPAFAQPATEATKALQGSWVATSARRDGGAADDVVGHRLAFSVDRFQILSKDGKPLFAGTYRVNPTANPAAIDFEHTEGTLKGKAWKGIYALKGEPLTIIDNAPDMAKGRPVAFEAGKASGYVLVSFARVRQ